MLYTIYFLLQYKREKIYTGSKTMIWRNPWLRATLMISEYPSFLCFTSLWYDPLQSLLIESSVQFGQSFSVHFILCYNCSWFLFLILTSSPVSHCWYVDRFVQCWLPLYRHSFLCLQCSNFFFVYVPLWWNKHLHMHGNF